MLLYIVRHAWAEDRDTLRWPDDGLRPLTRDGQKRFAKLIKRLAGTKFAPVAIATSPLVRCKETAELIAANLPSKPEIVPLDALAPGSDLAALIQCTNQQGENSVAWVGHAPDVGRLVAELIGNKNSAIHFAKGAVAAIEFEASVQAGEGELQWLATAKLLGI